MTPDRAPKAPEGLGEPGRTAWVEAWGTGWLDAADRAQVAHLARLEDEAEALAERIECDGPVARRPIVSPRGDVVGEEWVAHPLLGQLRRLGTELQAVRASLALTPASRARLALERFEPRPDALDELVERRRKRLAKRDAGHNGRSYQSKREVKGR